MELLEQLECVEVVEENGDKKITLTFMDEERGEIRNVQFNKQKYDNGKYVDDEQRAEKIVKMFAEDTGLEWEQAYLMEGQRADVYDYEKFCSLHPVDIVNKFTEDMKGEIYDTEIKEIVDDDYGIHIKYEIDGSVYESKMMHGKYLEKLKKWMKDPQKKEKQLKKFEEKFGVPVSKKDELIGKRIMVEVKTAFGTSLYGDIKKLPKKK